ncbi:MAG: aquaporin [Bacteroidetes bacterium]|nr:aquaporin [Bacteroidota bacterium]MBS1941923.1 aquaporin [Bacteroidota bacterium]
MSARRYLAEVIGTFGLVFCGTGAIVIDEQTGGAVGHIGVAITFGLIVLAMIYAFGEISGAHLNPAVTLGFVAADRFPLRQVAPYMAAQLVGALLASYTLHWMFPKNMHLGATMPAGSSMQSFVLEVILSYLLMFVILQVAHGSKEAGVLAGIAIGATVGLEAMFAGPICGASMNPVRSLAPAIVSGSLSSVWIYLIAPVLGTLAASFTWRVLRPKQQSSTDQ